MAARINIIVVEDEISIRSAYENAISEYKNIYLIGTTDNTNTAIKMVCDYSPDVIILDLELHKGYGNGIDLLKQISSTELDKKPFLLVVTNNVSPVTHSIVRNLGADFVITKNQQDYSEKMVLNFLNSILDTATISNNHTVNSAVLQAENEMEYSKKVKSRISKELDLIGISPKLKGRQYLADAIELTIEKRTTKISSIIAQKYSKTDASVERAMDTAINRTWRNTDIDTLEKYYTAYINPDKGVPTQTEFIFYYANKIKENI